LDAVGERKPAVIFDVDIGKVGRTGGEMIDHFAAFAVNDDDVVVFLQRHGEFVGAIEVGVFRLGIFTGNLGKAGQFGHPQAVAVGGAFGNVEERHVAARKLRDHAVVEVFIALVFHRDGDQ